MIYLTFSENKKETTTADVANYAVSKDNVLYKIKHNYMINFGIISIIRVISVICGGQKTLNKS
jgi:hypothetical protein